MRLIEPERYYKLKELKTITSYKDRMLKYKIKEVVKIFGEEWLSKNNLIMKQKARWIIADKMIPFFVKERHRVNTMITINFTDEISTEILTKYMCDYADWLENERRDTFIHFVIERDDKNKQRHHIHFVSNLKKKDQKKYVEGYFCNVLDYALFRKEAGVSIDTTDIYFKNGLVNYLRKGIVRTGMFI